MAAGAAGTLFHASYRFNCNKRSTSTKLHFAGVDLATAKTRAVAIADYLKPIMPVDCEIVSCILSNDNSKKDGKLIRGAAGSGTYVSPGVGPPPTNVNRDMDAIQLRLESDEGIIPLKIAPVPDEIIAGDEFTVAITDVDPVPIVAPAAAGSGADFAANFNLLMKAITFYSHHVKSGHAPGGAYDYFPFTACFALKPSGKRGARLIA